MGPSERGSGRPAFIYLEAEKPRAERIPRARAKTDAGEQHRVEDGHRERFLELRLERLRRQLGPDYEVTGRSERVRQEGVANCTYRVGATLWPRFACRLDLGFGRSRFGADWLDTAPAMRLLEVMRGGEDDPPEPLAALPRCIDAGRRREPASNRAAVRAVEPRCLRQRHGATHAKRRSRTSCRLMCWRRTDSEDGTQDEQSPSRDEMRQGVLHALDLFGRLLLEALHFDDLGDQDVIGLTDGLSGHVRRPRKPIIRDRVQRPADDVAILRHKTFKVLGQLRRTEQKPHEKGRRRNHARSVVVGNRNMRDRVLRPQRVTSGVLRSHDWSVGEHRGRSNEMAYQRVRTRDRRRWGSARPTGETGNASQADGSPPATPRGGPISTPVEAWANSRFIADARPSRTPAIASGPGSDWCLGRGAPAQQSLSGPCRRIRRAWVR